MNEQGSRPGRAKNPTVSGELERERIMKKSRRESVADKLTNLLFTLPAVILYTVFFI